MASCELSRAFYLGLFYDDYAIIGATASSCGTVAGTIVRSRNGPDKYGQIGCSAAPGRRMAKHHGAEPAAAVADYECDVVTTK